MRVKRRCARTAHQERWTCGKNGVSVDINGMISPGVDGRFTGNLKQIIVEFLLLRLEGDDAELVLRDI